MSNETCDVKSVFKDVRRSFRLLHQYHRVVQDITEVVVETFNLEYYYRETHHCGGAPNAGTDICSRWAWDFLPLYDVSLLYFPRHLKAGRDAYHQDHSAGDWMMELSFVADSVWEDFDQKGEPDPSKFKSVEESESLIYLRLWFLCQDVEGENWYRDIWCQNDWPDVGQTTGDIDVNNKVVGKIVESCWNFEDIVNRQSLVEKLFEFRSRVGAELQMVDLG